MWRSTLMLTLGIVFLFGAWPLLAQEAIFMEPSLGEWDALVQQIRGVNGFSLFVMALIVVQVLFLLFRTVFGELLGLHRLWILAILSVGATIGANILSGKTVIQSVLLDSGTLFAYQVALHQIKRQWEKRLEDREHLDMVRRAGRMRRRKTSQRSSDIAD